MRRRRLAWVVSEAPHICRWGLIFDLNEAHEWLTARRKIFIAACDRGVALRQDQRSAKCADFIRRERASLDCGSSSRMAKFPSAFQPERHSATSPTGWRASPSSMRAVSSPSMSKCQDALLLPSLRQESPTERTDISVARFADHAQAERAVKALVQAGVGSKQMSIVSCVRTVCARCGSS